MKSLILAVVAATVLAGSFTANAADRKVQFDGYKFFAEQERFSGR